MSEIEQMETPGQITLYLVGTDRRDARRWNPYDSLEEARNFVDVGNEGMKVFRTIAWIDYDAAEEL